MKQEREPAAIDWRDLFLILALATTIFLTLDHVIEWTARRWSIDMLQVQSSKSDSGTLLAMALSVWVTSRITSVLGFKPSKRPGNLDSEPSLP